MGTIKIQRAVFEDGKFRSIYTLEKCDTYTLYDPKREHCVKCGGETNYHWRRMAEIEQIVFLCLNEKYRSTIISSMTRWDITRPVKEFIPFEEKDL